MRHSITITAYAITSWWMISVATAEENRVAAAEEKITRLTNEFRNDNGLNELSTRKTLSKAAVKFANFMLTESKYGHYADGRRPSERADDAGYDYCVVRENIAYRVDPRQPDASAIGQYFFEGWKSSQEHRDNMLGAHIQETGVAIATKDGNTFYAVQMFGRPASAKFKIEIKNETDTTQNLVFGSGDARDEISVPANAVLSMSRCVKTTVLLEPQPSEKVDDMEAKIDRLTVKDSCQFAIIYGPNRQAVLTVTDR